MTTQDSTEFSSKTLPAFSKEFNGRLVRLDDDIYNVLSSYYFHHAALTALSASDRVLQDDKLLLGLSLTEQWLAQQRDTVLDEISALKALAKVGS